MRESIGKYRILKHLGEGGFGAVYLAHDDRVDRDVAIKLFRPRDENMIAFATSSSEDGLQVLRERFVREARILGRLSDSLYIINVYEFGETKEGSPYYVMPYVASHLGQLLGRDVFDRAALAELDRSDHPRALPLEQCLTLLRQVLQGMKVAHGHGLVHRDIKPSNILLSDAGEVRIADFGIAKSPDGSQTTVSQLGMGSRNYMAPEQRESARHVDGRADVYSLGVLAYRMLTGKLPTGRYADPEVAVPQLGKALNGVILKALSEDKETRFRDAGEMLAACEVALNQRGQEDKAGTYTGTFTDLSSDGPVSGVPEKFRPLYELIDSTLLEYGDVGPKLGQLQGMAAVAGLNNETLQSAVRDRIQGDKELQGIVNLHKLIQKEIAASTDSVKDLVAKLLPAAELAGKDRAWLEARLQAAAAEQDSLRSSAQAASHRTSKHVVGSPDAELGKRRVLSAAVFAVVAVSVVGLWFWSGVSDDGGQFWSGDRVTRLPPPADVSQSPPAGSGDRTETTALRPEQADITLAELTSGNSIFQVTTNEHGVTVLLDGVELGRTPLSREDLRPGSYTLSLQSPYHADLEVPVTLADGVVFKEDYVLQAGTGQLTVLSEPAGAAVYIDDHDTGEVTPVTLNDVTAGTRALSLRLVGYQTTEAQTVTVEKEQTARVSETLRKTWRLTVNTTPSNAVILLPDISPAYRPEIDLLPGEYRVEVSAPHYVPQTRTVSLEDSNQIIGFVLEPVLYPVIITSNVTDARITLSGNGNDYTYRSDLRLPAGSYQIEVSAPEHVSQTRAVSLVDSDQVIEFALEPFLPVTITSNVTDARITLRDNGNDYTYRQGLRLPAGSYQVEVSAPDYVSRTRTMSLVDSNQVIDFVLEPILYPVTITSNVKDARITLRGNGNDYTYRQGLRLQAGSYQVEVSAQEYVSQTRTVSVVDSDQIINIVLEPVLYPVTITSNVTDAHITLSGNGNNFTHRDGLRLPAGSYQVHAAAEGYYSLSEIWEVAENNGRLTLELEIVREPGEIFRDPLDGGGEGPLLVVLPAGSFRMGCLSDDSDCRGNEKPVQEVTLPNQFAMGAYEVSFAEYDIYVQATGARGPAYHIYASRTRSGDQPVSGVNWEEARAYVGWLSEQTGRNYRLPTEAEWEYAARAGTTTKYSWGNVASHEQTNYDGGGTLVQERDHWLYAAPVGSFPANGFGLYDMHGNVWEWTLDCWNAAASTNGQVWEGVDCDDRVVRGGGYNATPRGLRAAFRDYSDASDRNSVIGSKFYGSLGIRLVRDLP